MRAGSRDSVPAATYHSRIFSPFDTVWRLCRRKLRREGSYRALQSLHVSLNCIKIIIHNATSIPGCRYYKASLSQIESINIHSVSDFRRFILSRIPTISIFYKRNLKTFFLLHLTTQQILEQFKMHLLPHLHLKLRSFTEN